MKGCNAKRKCGHMQRQASMHALVTIQEKKRGIYFRSEWERANTLTRKRILLCVNT